jgi:glycosyltransferase involved in cell wall biosynthesis
MYFIPIIVPIFIEGDRRFIHSDWKRALRLLGDSLEERYGELVVAAPWLPAAHSMADEQCLEEVAPGEGIRLEPIFDGRVRARRFWLREVGRIRERLELLLASASVVHTGSADLFRPMMELAFLQAVRRGLPTVFVQDTDTVLQIRESGCSDSLSQLKDAAYTSLYERTCRASVAHADLSLLKGKALIRRYGRYAKNPREFHNTSYLSSELSTDEAIERRLASLSQERPLRLVYCGRLVDRKGLGDSVRMVELARRRGAKLTFDVIGKGPDERLLREQIERAALGEAVRLLGARRYDAELLRDLAGYDAMLFSPTIEDTPRMVFDGYAAGLPLIGVGIPYVQERAEQERATLLLPRRSVSEAAERLVALDRDRSQLISLTRAALRAGRYHAGDIWYKRRAEWTHEAVAAKRRTARPRHVGPDMLAP